MVCVEKVLYVLGDYKAPQSDVLVLVTNRNFNYCMTELRKIRF